MKQSDNLDQLAKALSEAQKEMPVVAKEKLNPFFKSNYADLSAVVQTCSPIITKHGLSVSQFPDFDGEHDLLTTRLLHESGQWLEASMRLIPVKQDPQSQGSAISYARRYAYCACLGVVADEDDDGNAASRPSGSHQTQQSPTTKPTTSKSEPDTGREMRGLFAILNGIKTLKEDGARHKWASEVLGREVTTFSGIGSEDIVLLKKAAKEYQIQQPTTQEYEDDDPQRPF